MITETPRKIVFRERIGLVREKGGGWATFKDYTVFFNFEGVPAFSAGNRDACLEFIRGAAGPDTVVIYRFEDIDLSTSRSWLNESRETILHENHILGNREF